MSFRQVQIIDALGAIVGFATEATLSSIYGLLGTVNNKLDTLNTNVQGNTTQEALTTTAVNTVNTSVGGVNTTLGTTNTTLSSLLGRFVAAAALNGTLPSRPTTTQVGALGYAFDSISNGLWTQLVSDGSGRIQVRPSFSFPTVSRTAALEDYRGISFSCQIMRIIAYHHNAIASANSLFLLVIEKSGAPANGDSPLFCVPFPSDSSPEGRKVDISFACPHLNCTSGGYAVVSTTPDVVTFPGGGASNATMFFVGGI